MLSHISQHSTPCHSYSPFVLQTSGKPNHVVGAINSGYTKPRATFLPQEHSMYQTTCLHSTNHLQHHSTKGQHDTLYGSIALPFKYGVFAIFFLFATIPATPHYLGLTDRHSLQYGMFTFLLHFMTNTFFWTFLTLSPPPSTSTLFLNHTASPIPCTAPSLTPLTKNNFSDPTPIFPQSFTWFRLCSWVDS